MDFQTLNIDIHRLSDIKHRYTWTFQTLNIDIHGLSDIKHTISQRGHFLVNI